MTVDPQKKGGFSGKLVHYVLCKKAASNKSTELWFNFDGKPILFSIYEFAIVTGLAWSKTPGTKVGGYKSSSSGHILQDKCNQNLRPPHQNLEMAKGKALRGHVEASDALLLGVHIIELRP